MEKLRIGVFGHAKHDHLSPASIKWIEDFGQEISKNGHILYTGGGGGVMESVRKGCVLSGGVAVSINPESSSDEIPNEHLGMVIASGQGKVGRTHLLVQSIDLAFAFGGGAGTLMEIIGCYLISKPILVVDGFQKVNDPILEQIISTPEDEFILGHKLIKGFLDGKDREKVFPIRICNNDITPEKALKIGVLMRENFPNK